MNLSTNNCPLVEVFYNRVSGVDWFDSGTKINLFLNVLLSFIATLGNGLIIVAILRSQNLQLTPSYLLITSLAFTDLLVGLVFHPLQIVVITFYLQRNLIQLCTIDRLFMFVSAYSTGISIAMVTCISIDRYLALTLRHRYTIIVTRKRVRFLIVFAWTLITLIFGTLGMIEKLYESLYLIGSCLYLFLLSITCILYFKSFRAIHLYTVQVHAQQPNPLAGNFDVVRYKKTLKTMVVVLACLLLCYLPLVCALISRAVLGPVEETIFLYFVSFTFIGLSSSVNPVIYWIRFADIRSSCTETLRNCVR